MAGRYLRTNYRKTGGHIDPVSPGSAAGAAASGYVFVSGGTLFVFKSEATFLVFSAPASGSIADL